MKFLIVDSSPEIRASIKKIINSDKQEHRTAEVANYDDAFFCLYSFSPDYVIIDLDCLYGDGLMLLKSSLTLLPAVRVFLFTEFNEIIEKHKLIDLGAVKIFSKSTDIENFIKELSAVFNSDVNTEMLCSS